MKKMLLVLALFLAWTYPARADQIDDGLPGAPAQVREMTRQMVQAGIESQQAVSLTREMERHRFSLREMEQVAGLLSQARRQKVDDGMISKAREGLAKQVSVPGIIRAIEAVRARNAFGLEQAGLMTPNRERARVLARTMAEGLAAGMSESHMRGLVQASRERTREMTQTRAEEICHEAMVTVREMARMGVTSENVASAVGQAMAHGYREREMQTFRNSFMERAQRTEANQVARNFAKAISVGTEASRLGTLGSSESGDGSDDTGSTGSGNGYGGSSGGGDGTGHGAGGGGSGGGGSGGGGGGSGGGGGGGGGRGGSGGGAGGRGSR